jgi:hypothetical protein
MHGHDSIRWTPALRVDKYDDDQTAWVARRSGLLTPKGSDFEAAKVRPYETVEVVGNLLTTAGLQRLTNLLIGAGGTALTNTTARIGVGDSSTAAAVGQTDLQAAAGSTHRWFQVMDATFPTAVNGLVTLRATFATGDGNFVWAEVCSDIGTATVTSGNTVNATMLNRFVQALGTKASGSWVLTETITLS